MQKLTISRILDLAQKSSSIKPKELLKTPTEELQEIYDYFLGTTRLSEHGNIWILGAMLRTISQEIHWRNGTYSDIEPTYYEGY